MKKDYSEPSFEIIEFERNASFLTVMSGCGVHTHEGTDTPVCSPNNNACTNNW